MNWRRLAEIIVWAPVALIGSLVVLAGLISTLLVIAFLFGSAYSTVVPAHTVETEIAELRAKVTLDFYYVWGNESGRFVTIRTPQGQVRANICGYDWAHYGRTNIYVTEDRKIAIVGYDLCDLIFDLGTMSFAEAKHINSEHWRYLGAFRIHPRTRVLSFSPVDHLPECIERGGEFSGVSWAVRKTFSKDRCAEPTMTVEEARQEYERLRKLHRTGSGGRTEVVP